MSSYNLQLPTLIFFSLFSLLATSQEAQRRFKGLSLEDLLNLKISLSTGIQEKINEAPSSMTVFTSSEIQSMGVSSLQELLNFVPGFQSTLVVTDGAYHAIQPRGRKTPGGGSPDVLILMDGLRLNDSHTGGASNFSRFTSLAGVERVEIIRGPGSALYGSNAFLGVINIITHTGKNDVLLTVGDHEMAEGNLNLSHSFGSLKLDLFLSAFTQDGHPYQFPNTTVPKTTDPRKGHDVNISLNYGKLTIKYRHQMRSLGNFFNFNFPPTSVNVNKTWENSFNASYAIASKPAFSLTARLTYMRHRWRALTEIPSSNQNPPFLAGPYYWNHDQSLSLHMSHQSNTRHQLVAGLTLRETGNDHLKALTTYTPLEAGPNGQPHDEPVVQNHAVPGEKNYKVWGVYLQERFKPNPEITIFLGARFDRHDHVQETFNPRGGIIFSPARQTRIKALYGAAFRAPSLTEVYNKSPVRLDNPNLEPEKIRTVELNINHDIGNHARISLTWFKNLISNEITGRLFQDEGIQKLRFQNNGQTRSQGLEWELSWEINPAILIKSTYTSILDYQQKSRGQTTGNASSYNHYGSLFLNYSGPNWSANINGVYRGKIGLLPQQDPYFIANIKGSYRLTSAMSLHAVIGNVLNETYVTYAEDFSILQNAIPNRGRQADISLKIRY